MSGIFSTTPSPGSARLMIGGLIQSSLACILVLIAPDPSAAMLRAAVALMVLTGMAAFLLAVRCENPDLQPYWRRPRG